MSLNHHSSHAKFRSAAHGGARAVTVRCASLPTSQDGLEFFLYSLEGQESLSELYRYQVVLETPRDLKGGAEWTAANLDLNKLIGKEMTLEIELEDGGKREISGLIETAGNAGLSHRSVRYTFVLRPWLWLATRSSDFRRFHNKNVLEVIDEVLAPYPYFVERQLGRQDYPKREYQVQYGETDYHLFSRLMHEAGLHYRFEHKDGKHTLVLCDGLTVHPKLADEAYQRIEYHPMANQVADEHVEAFELRERLCSGDWSTNNFDFTRPYADLTVRNCQPRDTAHADFAMFEWPGSHWDIQEGENTARARMEAQRTQGVRGFGSGNLRGAVVGHRFMLERHPHAAANREYLIVGTVLMIQQGRWNSTESGKFACHATLEVQPTSEVFHAERAVLKPRTSGPQTAIVVGPPGEEIWTDRYGRVLVQFHWDRYGTRDEGSSAFVRVAQPWAGRRFGAVFIPRIGQEVIVDHLNGDPDMPIIIGSVYNNDNMPPWPLPANATQSGFLTRSSMNGTYANANALRFEDKKGAEQVWIHAERNMDTEVELDETLTVGNNRTKRIGANEFVKVAMARWSTIGMAHIENVGLAAVENVGAGKAVNVGGGYSELVGLGKSEIVGGAYMTLVGLYRKEAYGGAHTQTVGAAQAVTVGGVQAVTVGGAQAVTVGGARAVSVVGAMNTKVGGFNFEEVGLGKKTVVGGERCDVVGLYHQVAVGGYQDVTIAGAQSVKAGGLIHHCAGAGIKLQCGSSEICMMPDGITLMSGGSVVTLSSAGITINGQLVKINC